MKNNAFLKKDLQDFEPNQQLFSPRSNIEQRVKIDDPIEQYFSNSDFPILSEQSLDYNLSKHTDHTYQLKKKSKKKLCLSLTPNYSPNKNKESGVNLKSNSIFQLPSSDAYYNNTYKSLQQQQVYQQKPYLSPSANNQLSLTQQYQKKPLQQSLFYKNENSTSIIYDCNEKKEFFRAIKFNLFNKKRNSAASSNSYGNISQQQNSQQNMKKYISSIEAQPEKKYQLNKAYFQDSGNDKEIIFSTEKIGNTKLISSIQNSSNKSQNIPSTNFNQSQKLANQLLPNQFLTPQSKHQNSLSSRSLASNTFSESVEPYIQPQNLNTPLTQKDKKNNDRIKKIMNFNLAKEMNKIVSNIKQKRQKEQNPSILKLPTIKSSQTLQKENPVFQSLANIELNDQPPQVQMNSTTNLSNISKQIYLSGTKKKQVHFIIDEIDLN